MPTAPGFGEGEQIVVAVALVEDRPASDLAERVEAAPGLRQDEDLEVIAVELSAKHVIVKRRLERLHLAGEATQRQGAHVDLHETGLNVAVQVRDLEGPVRQERQP